MFLAQMLDFEINFMTLEIYPTNLLSIESGKYGTAANSISQTVAEVEKGNAMYKKGIHTYIDEESDFVIPFEKAGRFQ